MIGSRSFGFVRSPNIRHLGGYATRSGRLTSSRFVRGSSLHRLEARDIAEIRGYGITCVVDLRSRTERERDRSPQLADYGITLLELEVLAEDASPLALGRKFEGHAALYRRMLDTGGAAFGVLVDTIARSDGGVMFHCAGGKDRTGVAAALLLDIAGVDPATIIADYAVSADLLAGDLERIVSTLVARGASEETARAVTGSPAVAMRTTLNYIYDQWGSSEGYMASLGIETGTVDRARSRLLGD